MLTELRETVRLRLELGDSLEAIERDVVEPAPLDEDRRSALWLFAWTRAEAVASGRR